MKNLIYKLKQDYWLPFDTTSRQYDLMTICTYISVKHLHFSEASDQLAIARCKQTLGRGGIPRDEEATR